MQPCSYVTRLNVPPVKKADVMIKQKMLVHFKHLIRSKLPVFLVFIAAFLLSFCGLLAEPVAEPDEIIYIAAGVWYVNFGWWFFNPEHPPVFKLIVGTVLWLVGVRTTAWIPFPPPLGRLLVTYPPPTYVVYIARLPAAFMGSLTACLVYYLAKELTKNQKTSLISGLFLALYPIHIDLSRTVVLEASLTFFVTLTLLLMHRALARNDKRCLIAGSFAYGLALGTKFPAIMILPILLTLAMALPNRKRNLAYVGLSTLIASAVIFAVWPYLWPDPLGNLQTSLDYHVKHHFKGNPPYLWWSYCILSATPFPVLIFFLLGLILMVCQLKRPTALLTLAWFLVPFTFLTMFISYRHIAYFSWLTPSVCLIAGYGLTALDHWMRKHKLQLCISNYRVYINFNYILVAVVILTALLVVPTYPEFVWPFYRVIG